MEITWSWYKNPATNLPIIFILVLVKFEILNFKMKQKLHSWFEANAKFPSTTPAAYMIKSAGLYLSLSQTYLILQSTLHLSYFNYDYERLHDPLSTKKQMVNEVGKEITICRHQLLLCSATANVFHITAPSTRHAAQVD